MNYYQLFGQVLASEIELPELPAAPPSGARWELTCTTASAPAEPLRRMGAEAVMDGVNVVLYGSRGRFRLAYDDTGVFDIADGGRKIVWHRPANSSFDPRSVRTDVLGRVMAVALHADAIPTLHASGVVLGGKAMVFVAPKLHGKSTTAAALVRAGGQLLGDDIMAVVPGILPMVLPGIPAVHVWRDTADRLRKPPDAGDATCKQRIDWNGLGARAEAAVPLGAIYLLTPVRAAEGAGVARTQLPSVAAALALVGQAKIGALLGRVNAAVLLEQFAQLSAIAPVYRLTIPREFDRLDNLVSRMSEWHDAPLRTSAAGAAG